ncbi:arabinofuranosyltransferase [Skermania sp. ID1734]|uniref:galactan 5-O-arabinofuranosyltransferase n=1 Tax=Skermania sp. ID1734 TaxID=2597516 RepID=UPI00117ED5A2|nr:galactan 5-O-arabinofuranosyltransferase [Skermania sp. ID1734]TSE00842.1 arabinofuranosyltransferase [Skermania sp. ID1734]
MVVAAIVAAVVAAVGLTAFSVVHWPAFNSSNVTRALTTVGQIVAIAALGLSIYLLRIRKWAWFARVLSWAALSGFVTVTLGMPLAATKLYLMGISVDQEFRTEYLTRLTDSAALHDMTYINLPPYYPAGWFWVGGRMADLFGMPGWEAFKPYAIGSLAVASVLALVLWNRLIRSDWAIVVALAGAAIVLAYASPEAYGAVIAVLVPPVLVLAWGGLHRNSGGWAAVVASGIFVGIAATFYTLYAGFIAFTVVGLAVVAALLRVRREQTWRAGLEQVKRLVVIGAIGLVIALIVWTPYLLELRHIKPSQNGTAFHYLPEAGSQLPLPMLQFSLLGAFCLLGTLWLVVRSGSSRRAQSLGVGVVAIYVWSFASMAFTALGSTLLSFRLEPILLVLLSAAGTFGFLEASRAIFASFGDSARIKFAALALGIIGAIAFAQDIPHTLAAEITTAYTDTDGNGHRADERPPSAVAYYGKIDSAITDQLRRQRDQIVVLTADTSFLAYYPYYGFQALTSHYANPLAHFNDRAATIKQWSELGTPNELIDALDHCQWRAPDVFLFRHSADGYSLRLAEDVYPNDPNVRRYTVTFGKSLFADSRFVVTDIGPFTLVTRNR